MWLPTEIRHHGIVGGIDAALLRFKVTERHNQPILDEHRFPDAFVALVCHRDVAASVVIFNNPALHFHLFLDTFGANLAGVPHIHGDIMPDVCNIDWSIPGCNGECQCAIHEHFHGTGKVFLVRYFVVQLLHEINIQVVAACDGFNFLSFIHVPNNHISMGFGYLRALVIATARFKARLNDS